MKRAQFKGFTLIEMMITVAILGILAAIAVPSFLAFKQKKEVKSVVDKIHVAIKNAKNHAANKQEIASINFNTLTQYDIANLLNFSSYSVDWCVGVKNGGACDCSTSNSCTFNGAEYTFNNSDYNDVRMIARKTWTFTSAPTLQALVEQYIAALRPDVEFDQNRNMSSENVWITIWHNTGGYSASMEVNQFGVVDVCSNNMNEYPNC